MAGSWQAMGIQRYVFFSIHNADRHPDVPLMQIKARTEEFLAASGLNFTILRLCGFMQAIIGNYAVPILEEKQVWGTSDATRTAYLDSQVQPRLSRRVFWVDALVDSSSEPIFFQMARSAAPVRKWQGLQTSRKWLCRPTNELLGSVGKHSPRPKGAKMMAMAAGALLCPSGFHLSASL